MNPQRRLSVLFCHYGIKDSDGFGRSFLLAKNLAKFGHRISFLTSQNKEFHFPWKREMRENVEIISFPDIVPRSVRKGGLGPLNIILKSLFALGRSYDIVHSDSGHRPSAGVPCLLHKRLRGSLYVSEWWDYFGKGGIYDEMPAWYQRTLGNYDTVQELRNKRKADGVVVLSEFTRERALKLGKKDEDVLLLHGGADTDAITLLEPGPSRKKFGIDESALTFGFIGMNEGELKDILPFVEAVRELRSGINVNWFTTGYKLSAETKGKYGIGNELIEFGWVDYALYSEYLACADAFLLLLQDNIVNKARWPNKLGDYFAAGRMILSNPVGELDGMTRRYPASFIRTDRDKDAIREKILAMYRSREELLTQGRANRAIAERELSWEQKARDLEQFYFSLLGKKDPAR